MDDPVLVFKRIAGAMVVLPFAPLLAALFGQLIRRRWPALGSLLVVGGLLVALASTLPPFSRVLIGLVEGDEYPALTAERARALMAESALPPRAIVILGGGTRFDSRERPDTTTLRGNTLERVVAGARLARATGLPVLVSGGAGPDDREAEATTMARVLARDFGITSRWVETRSRDTVGNARESAQMLAAARVGRVLLVTQAYHLPRAAYAFEHAGIRVVGAPTGFLGGRGAPDAWLPSVRALHTSYLASHEAVGLLWHRMVRYARGEAPRAAVPPGVAGALPRK